MLRRRRGKVDKPDCFSTACETKIRGGG